MIQGKHQANPTEAITKPTHSNSTHDAGSETSEHKDLQPSRKRGSARTSWALRAMFAGVAVVMLLTTVANAGETLPALKSTATKSRIQAALLTYADRSYEWRKSALAIYQRLVEYQDSHDGKILSSDLRDMHRMANLYVSSIRQPLIDIMRSPYFYMDLEREIRFQNDRETYVERNVVLYQDITGARSRDPSLLQTSEILQETILNIHHINPHDPEGRAILKDYKVSLAASLLLLDNYAVALEPYFNNNSLRRSLLYDMPDTQWDARNEVKNIWLNYKNSHQSLRLVQAVAIYMEAKTSAALGVGATPPPGPYLQELDDLIQNSLTFRELEEDSSQEGLLHRLVQTITFLATRPRDAWFRIRFHITRLTSKVFVTSAGVFEFRDGKLNDLPKETYNTLVSRMKPLDILLEKAPFRLTDQFIPGYYGHVAVWVGTERELKEAGVWDELPDYYNIARERYAYQGPPFQKAIRQGRHILEALPSGVELNSMRQFLNIDDLAVLRPRACREDQPSLQPCLSQSDQRKYLIEAFKQIGKEYDFNFNVNTEAQIVCSELAYRTFLKVDFNTTKTLRKHTISPDQVALKALQEDDLFYPVLMYFDGKPVSGNTDYLRHLLSLLISDQVAAVETLIENQHTESR